MTTSAAQTTGAKRLCATVSKLLGPGRTVLLSEAPEEDARYGVARRSLCRMCAPREAM